MDDLCRQVSWLAALAPSPAFPRTPDFGIAQWHYLEMARRLQLRGQPRFPGM